MSKKTTLKVKIDRALEEAAALKRDLARACPQRTQPPYRPIRKRKGGINWVVWVPNKRGAQ